MVYKYQQIVIEEISDAIDTIEEMTEEHYRMQIGYRHTNEFDQENIPIFLEINGESQFTQQTNLDSQFDYYSRCPILNYNRIELFNDIFLDLNKLIDKIITDNKKREKFYNTLNNQLQALNESLKVVSE